MDCVSQYKSIIGKTGPDGYLPLWMHLKDTAGVMRYLCVHRTPDSVISACELTRKEFENTCVFLAMVHDIGKCTPVFAAKIIKAVPWYRSVIERAGIELPSSDSFLSASKSPHTVAGQAILEKAGCPDGFCAVTGAHHGRPTKSGESDYQLEAYSYNYYAHQTGQWQNLQNQVLMNALVESGYETTSALPVLSNCAQMLLCGLLIEADWIASNQLYFPVIDRDSLPQEELYPERIKKAVELLSLPDCWKPQKIKEVAEVFYVDRFGFSPNMMQKKVFETAQAMNGSGLMIIEAQMGTGKTEAAMAAAEIMSNKSGSGGVFIGLPTQATTNGMFKRAADWTNKISKDGEHSIRLVHGMAELNEDYKSYFRGTARTEDDSEDKKLYVHGWFTGKKQAMLADFVVGTVDTALMAALSQKHVMLRHIGLCGKTVIIDECHAYDSYMNRYLCRVLRWLGAYHIPVILLSATLPKEKKLDMVRAYSGERKLILPDVSGYPLVTKVSEGRVDIIPIEEKAADTEVVIRKINEDSLIDDIKEKTSGGGCVGIIVNTVKRAQALSQELKRNFPQNRIIVYHAQFLAEDRIKREKWLSSVIGKQSEKADRDNTIVVGTQVLEQSLDIDFDYLITDLCPMDLLLQRIGRLHRHHRPRPVQLERPICSILNTDTLEKGAAAVYGEWLLERTNEYLPEIVHLPMDIPKLVNQVYNEPDDSQKNKYWEEYVLKTDLKRERATDWLLCEPKKSRREVGNSLTGMMDTPIDSDKRAEASVRDGNTSIDVLVMRQNTEDHLTFMPWVSDTQLRCDAVPSEEEAKRIAMQKVRLPFSLCMGEKLDETITFLENENLKYIPIWQDSPWLKGELVMILDESGEKNLCGYRLRYDGEYGLTYERIRE